METKGLRLKSAEELIGVLRDLLREQFNLRMHKGSGQPTKPNRLREVRRDIARVKTVMNEKNPGIAA